MGHYVGHGGRGNRPAAADGGQPLDRPTYSELSAEGLTTLRFFRGESPDALEWLLDTSTRRHLRAGDVLLQPGTANEVDALTGLYNRRWLDQSLMRLTRAAELHDAPLGLIMSDLDNFKQYNDRHGHLAGDSALHSIATLISRTLRTLRPHDLAARYGGEEMIVLPPDTTLVQAMAIAGRLCEAVRSARLYTEDGRPLPGVTVSLGVAAECGAVSPGRLLAAADAALYRAKTQGRDRVSN